MKKCLLTLCLLLCLLSVAQGAQAGTPVTIVEAGGTVEMPDGFTLLTEGNVAVFTTALSNLGLSTWEEYMAYCAQLGVVAQGWNSEQSISITITCHQDDAATLYGSIKDLSNKQKREYVTGCRSGLYLDDDDLSVTLAQWYEENRSYRQILWLKYAQGLRNDKAAARGHQMRTIYAGYSICLDYRSYSNRTLAAVDGRTIKDMAETLSFTEGAAIPGATSGYYTGAPATISAEFTLDRPMLKEINTSSFKINGIATPQSTVTAECVLANRVDMAPLSFVDMAGSDGTFTVIPVLTEEGIWQITLTVSRPDLLPVSEFYYLEYGTRLMAVTFFNEFPAELTEDTLRVSGMAPENTRINLICGNVNKKLRVGSTGEFSYSLDTSAAGDYHLMMVFTNDLYVEPRSFSLHMNRALDEAAYRESVRKTAISPQFDKLVSSLEAYVNYTMTFTGVVTRVEQYEGQYSALLDVRGSDAVSHFIRVVSDDNLGFATSQVVTVYGTLLGSAPREEEAPREGATEPSITEEESTLAALERSMYPLLRVEFFD